MGAGTRGRSQSFLYQKTVLCSRSQMEGAQMIRIHGSGQVIILLYYILTYMYTWVGICNIVFQDNSMALNLNQANYMTSLLNIYWNALSTLMKIKDTVAVKYRIYCLHQQHLRTQEMRSLNLSLGNSGLSRPLK